MQIFVYLNLSLHNTEQLSVALGNADITCESNMIKSS